MHSYRHLPLSITSEIALKNRVVVPPMASGTATHDGFVTPETLAHYQRLAEARVGLMFVEYTYVHSSGKSEPHQLSVASDEHIAGLRQLVGIMKETSTVVGLQLTHAGGKSSPELAGGPLWGPSATNVPALDRTLPLMIPMTLKEIHRLIQWFVLAAERAQQAGFDLIELHCAHGYGLNQWLSPLTNRRTDSFGGCLEKRFRLIREIISAIRLACPRLLIAARIPGQDLLSGGLSIADMQWVAREMEKIGVHLIDVSSGLGGWRRPKARRGQGYLLGEAAAIKQAVTVPVIGVGGIHEGEFIDRMIRNGTADLAAVGRAILKDAAGWGNKHLVSAGRLRNVGQQVSTSS